MRLRTTSYTHYYNETRTHLACIEGNWYDVPDDAIINEPNRDGRTIVWPMHVWEGEKLTIAIRCFMPGSMT